jgi:hypothetical protein
VHRAFIVPLHRVKKWVLGTAPGIRWQTFSSSLARAPLSEDVGVCVLTKRNGAKFHPAGDAKPVGSVVAIVRPNGESTIFEYGTLASNLADTQANFAKSR